VVRAEHIRKGDRTPPATPARPVRIAFGPQQIAPAVRSPPPQRVPKKRRRRQDQIWRRGVVRPAALNASSHASVTSTGRLATKGVSKNRRSGFFESRRSPRKWGNDRVIRNESSFATRVRGGCQPIAPVPAVDPDRSAPGPPSTHNHPAPRTAAASRFLSASQSGGPVIFPICGLASGSIVTLSHARPYPASNGDLCPLCVTLKILPMAGAVPLCWELARNGSSETRQRNRLRHTCARVDQRARRQVQRPFGKV